MSSWKGNIASSRCATILTSFPLLSLSSYEKVWSVVEMTMWRTQDAMPVAACIGLLASEFAAMVHVKVMLPYIHTAKTSVPE